MHSARGRTSRCRIARSTNCWRRRAARQRLAQPARRLARDTPDPDLRARRIVEPVAASLAELGFTRAGDVGGGFEAWLAAGLPVTEAPPPGDGLPGTDSPA